MGFFSKLFGGSSEVKSKSVEPSEYKGYLIYAEPIPESGQFRIAGRITLGEGENLKTHRFIRSDVLSNPADANELMVKKAQMLIDQMGDSIFSD
jgi:hypothetical protein